MSLDDAQRWNERHRGKAPGAPEPFLVEMLSLVPHRGLALDVAAGRGRNTLLLARAGFTVVAVDVARAGLEILAATARMEKLAVWPAVMDFDNFGLCPESFDVIVNVNFSLARAFQPVSRAAQTGWHAPG